nr:hypothetical protein [Candidatus Frankia alpina]
MRVSELGDVFSGGQQLTAAIILYCTMAALRANDRGQLRAPHAGVLFLDNPIGRASAGYLPTSSSPSPTGWASSSSTPRACSMENHHPARAQCLRPARRGRHVAGEQPTDALPDLALLAYVIEGAGEDTGQGLGEAGRTCDDKFAARHPPSRAAPHFLAADRYGPPAHDGQGSTTSEPGDCARRPSRSVTVAV